MVIVLLCAVDLWNPNRPARSQGEVVIVEHLGNLESGLVFLPGAMRDLVAIMMAALDDLIIL
jgi:hypothetical protein